MLNDIDEAYASEQAIFIYPAGLVSRKNDAGEIVDLEWKKSFITKAKKALKKFDDEDEEKVLRELFGYKKKETKALNKKNLH